MDYGAQPMPVHHWSMPVHYHCIVCLAKSEGVLCGLWTICAECLLGPDKKKEEEDK